MISAILCLAEMAYHEARGESVAGQVAVMQVAMHRAEDPRYPSDLCGVVHQGPHRNGWPLRDRCQFAYYCDGRSDDMRDREARGRAVILATLVALGWLPEQAPGATHYYAGRAQPWPSEGRMVIGSHSFLVGAR